MQVLFAHRDMQPRPLRSGSGYTQEERKEVHRNLMQDIRIIPKRPLFLLLAQGFLVDVHLLSAQYVCAREVRATV